MKVILGLAAVLLATSTTSLVAQIPAPTVGDEINQARQTEARRPMAANACADAFISCGTSKSGTLSATDCIFVDKSYFDAWVFSGTAGQTVTINMSSTAFDTYLQLDNPSGGFEASNDDTNTTNSRITYKLPVSGSWRILAGSSKPAVIGNYDLSISCVDLGTPNLIPYKPSTWSDAIVVSTTPNTTPPFTDTPNITANDTVYISWAETNVGTSNVDPAAASTTAYGDRLYIDGVAKAGCNASLWPDLGHYVYCNYFSTKLTAGTHTLRLDVDPENLVLESNETDNSFTRTITVAGGSGAVCTPSQTVACLNNRFSVVANWAANGQTGQGTAARLTQDTSYFWFFNAQTAEVMVKEVDGRALNGKFWIFAGGLTNAEVTLVVTDVQTGQVRSYRNPAGTAFQPIQDTAAF